MARIANRDFEILDTEWRVDAKAYLKVQSLEHAIIKDGFPTPAEQAKALVYLKHHIHEELKSKYIFVEDPKELWDNLKDRFESLQRIIAPRAQHEWSNLRLQDFASVREYNSAVLHITSQLKLCGELVTERVMKEKTLTTKHPNNVVQQEQFRERCCEKFCGLIAILLVAEQNNHILFTNNNQRPTRSSALPVETNATRSRGRHNFRGRHYNRGRGHQNSRSPYRGKGHQQSRPRLEEKWFKCGIQGHWAKDCRTAKHLVDLYMASQKGKGKREANYVEENSPIPEFDVVEYLIDDITNV